MDTTTRNPTSVIIGVVLIALGILFLASQLFGIAFWFPSWQVFMIAGGLLALLLAIFGGRRSTGLAIPGAVVTTLGALLLYQDTFDHWQSWAYAWALIPTAAGTGTAIAGWRNKNPEMVRNGFRLAMLGLVMLTIGIVFFELVIGISGRRNTTVGGIFVPILLIGIGVFLILGRGMHIFGGKR